MSKPKVTIAIPNYNNRRYIAQAVSSALGQNFADIEVLVVDNDSTDGSLDALAPFEGDSRLRIVRNDSNIGAVRNFDRTVHLASANLIKFLCSDDDLHPDCVRRMVEVLDKNPSVGLVTSPRVLTDEEGKETGIYSHIDQDVLIPGEVAIRRFLLTSLNFIGEPTAVLFRKELYGSYGSGFGKTYAGTSDLVTWLEILQQSDLYHLRQPLCRFRQHSTMWTKNAGMMVEFGVEFSDLIRSYIDNGYLPNRDLRTAAIERILARLHEVGRMADPSAISRDLMERHAEAVSHWSSHPLLLSHLKTIEEIERRPSGPAMTEARPETPGTGVELEFPPDLSVILCSRGRPDRLHACLRALERQTLPKDRYEVVCVNDGSGEETRRVMLGALTRLAGSYHEHPERKGLAAARNTALAAARGKILCFLFDDTYPGPDTLRWHLIAHQAYAGLRAAFVGPIFFPSKLMERTLYRALTISALLFPTFGMQDDTPHGTDRCCLANFSIAAEAFTEKEPFDSSFESRWFVDLDAGYALERGGWRIYSAGQATVIHDHRLTARDWHRFEMAKSRDFIRFMKKHPELLGACLGVPSVDETTLRNWERIVRERGHAVPEVMAELASIQDRPLPAIGGSHSTADAQKMLTPIFERMSIVSEYEKYRSLLEAFAPLRGGSTAPEDGGSTREPQFRPTSPHPSATGRVPDRPLRITWEGSQFVQHSLALVNREICLELMESGNEVSIVPYEANQFGPEADPRYPRLAERILADLSGPPDVWVRHQWPPNFTPPAAGHWVMMQHWEFGRLPESWIDPMSTQVDEIWVSSRHVRGTYVSSGVPSDRVKVLPLGVNIRVFHPGVKPMPLRTGKKVKFLFVGGTIQRKGIDILLKAYLSAFTRKDDVVLIIKDMGQKTFYRGQGAGAMIEAVQKDPGAAEVLYLDDMLSETDMAGLYTACDCLAHPYRGEGFGLPVVEAMACGLPVIVTEGGATDDFCPDEAAFKVPATRKPCTLDIPLVGGSGWMLEPDPAALAVLLRQVAANPKQAREKAQVALSLVRQHLTWPKAAERMAEAARTLAAKPVRRMVAARETPQPLDAGQAPVRSAIAAELKRLREPGMAPPAPLPAGHAVEIPEAPRGARESSPLASHNKGMESSAVPSRLRRRSALRVLLAYRSDVDVKGGAAAVMNETCEALRAAGIQASTTHDLHPDVRGFDLVHCFNVWAPHSALDQLRYLKKTGIPVVWSPIYLDLGECAWATLAISAMYDRRHSPEQRREFLRAFALGTLEVNGIGRWKPNEVIPGYHAQLREMLGNVDHVCVTGFREIQALNQVTGFTSIPFTLTPHGVETRHIAAASPEPFRARFGSAPFVLCVGAVERRKNQLMILEALRDTNLKTVLMGPSFEKDYLEFCREVGGRNVLVTGRLPADLVASAYKAASVHVLPSFAEGAALANLEAAAAGCPIVVSNRSSEFEYFGDAPFYCSPNDPEAIRKATLLAVESREKEPERWEGLSRLVTERYTWERTAELTIMAYERTLDAGKSAGAGRKPGRDAKAREKSSVACADDTTSPPSSSKSGAWSPPPSTPARNVPVVWHAPIFDPSGYADEARNIIRNVSRSWPVHMVPMGKGSAGFVAGMDPAEKAFFASLMTPPPDGAKRLSLVSAPAYAFRRDPGATWNIGRTFFETDRIPAEWVPCCNAMDEIWVATDFNVETFRRSGVKKPIVTIPLGVDAEFFKPGVPPLDIPRRRGFAFLSIFEWIYRKGWDVLLRAWAEAFSPKDDVCLILRTYPVGATDDGSAPDVIEKRIDGFLKQTIGKTRREVAPILVMARQVPQTDMPRLYASADAFVLPSRGEGWGLPYMEAMACGLPVIGTRWGGNLAFMNDANSYLIDIDGLEKVDANMELPFYLGHQWSSPSASGLATLMREVFEHADAARRKGEVARRDVNENWTWRAAAKQVITRLGRIARGI